MKKPFLLSHKEQKAASTTRRSQKLGAVLTLLDEPQLIPRSQNHFTFPGLSTIRHTNISGEIYQASVDTSMKNPGIDFSSPQKKLLALFSWVLVSSTVLLSLVSQSKHWLGYGDQDSTGPGQLQWAMDGGISSPCECFSTFPGFAEKCPTMCLLPAVPCCFSHPLPCALWSPAIVQQRLLPAKTASTQERQSTRQRYLTALDGCYNIPCQFYILLGSSRNLTGISTVIGSATTDNASHSNWQRHHDPPHRVQNLLIDSQTNDFLAALGINLKNTFKHTAIKAQLNIATDGNRRTYCCRTVILQRTSGARRLHPDWQWRLNASDAISQKTC
ncbi:hypothetical protein Anapl_08146 [Anas platyrhynchos]|uniref:Uncharacterized protein n=1 Tax=Anas platyrhynchos TaxID=8839 RepID=R0KAS5_ANAPL|nr:hypothetical protein Anapl_08146 [Anas platyrhynchos]